MGGRPDLPTNIFARMRTDGYALIPIATKEQEVIAATLKAAHSFFRSPPAEKEHGRMPLDLGYRALAEEYSDSPDHPDQIESFSANLKGALAASHLTSVSALALYLRMLATINLLEGIAEAVTEQLATQLLGSSYTHRFGGAFRPWSVLQANYSRPASVGSELIHELHEDGCLITVLSAPTPGLEVQTPKGQLLQVTTRPDEVLAMPGEILWLLTGDAVRPLYHRVRPHRAHAERISLLFFGDIDPKRCTPWIQNETNAGVDIGARMLKNPVRFGLDEWTV